MENSTYVGVSGQISLARRLETIAHNMANVNTPGFRAEALKFASLTSPRAENNGADLSFVSAGKSYISLERGAITQSGNPLDVAIKGDAYLAMQTPAGKAYSRDGRLAMTSDGGLVSVQGYPVLDGGGAPLQLDVQAGLPTIGADGSITQNGKLIGALGLFQFQPDSQLRYGPNSSLIPDKEPMPVVDDPQFGVMQGYIESSNVNGVIEMTRLIDVSRAFERVEALLRGQEDVSRKAIETLGQTR